jgi:hypothetical protein
MSWQCTCSELHDDTFDTCWSCGRDRDGRPQPFQPDPGPPRRDTLIEALADHAEHLAASTRHKKPMPAYAQRMEARLAALETEVVSLRDEVRSLREQVRAAEKRARNT